jgi:hypothetical protein
MLALVHGGVRGIRDGVVHMIESNDACRTIMVHPERFQGFLRAAQSNHDNSPAEDLSIVEGEMNIERRRAIYHRLAVNRKVPASPSAPPPINQF